MKTGTLLKSSRSESYIDHSISSGAKGEQVVFMFNGSLKVIDGSAPNYKRVISALQMGDYDLLASEVTIADSINRDLAAVTDRLKIVGNQVLFDGKNLSSVLAAKIIQAKKMGLEYGPLVNFAERLVDNPSAYSREQLFSFLERHDFKIQENGTFIGYKGVGMDGRSVHSGTAYVDGKKITGKIPYEEGSEVTMPRDKVNHDPRHGCSTGLHIGSYQYANSFGSKLLTVEVDPVDVVSVPLDSNYQKIRSSRLVVLGYDPHEVNGSEGLYWTR